MYWYIFDMACKFSPKMKKLFIQISSMSVDGLWLVMLLFMLPFFVVFFLTDNNFVLLIPCIALYLFSWIAWYLITQKLYKEKSYVKFCIMIIFMIVYTLLGFIVLGYGSWTFF